MNDDLELASRLRDLDAATQATVTGERREADLSARLGAMHGAVRRRRRRRRAALAAGAVAALAVVTSAVVLVPRSLLDESRTPTVAAPGTDRGSQHQGATGPGTTPIPGTSDGKTGAPPALTPPASPSTWWGRHPDRRPESLSGARRALTATGTGTTRLDLADADLPAGKVVALVLAVTCTPKDTVALDLLDADGSTRLQTFITCATAPVVYRSTPIDPQDPPAVVQIEADGQVGVNVEVWVVPSAAGLPLPHHPSGKEGHVERQTPDGTVRSGASDARGSGIDFLGENYWEGRVDGQDVIVHAGSNGSEDAATGALHGDLAGAAGAHGFDALGAPLTVTGAGAMWITDEDHGVLTVRGEDGRTYLLDLRTWALTTAS